MGAPLRVLPPAPPAPEAGDELAKLRAERDRLLELLAQQQRVAQAGLVTSGLAHDIDNHVQIISGAAFLALQGDSPDEWRRALEKVQGQCCALTETTRAFLGFVRRRDAVGPETFRVTQVVLETERLVRPLARQESVAVETSVAEDATVCGERRLAIQALLNLATNAVQACAANRGEVSLEVAEAPDGFVRLVVRDNGDGIPDDVRERLFRPLSSGRGAEGGHGLGLFIVRQNVRRLGGSIRVRSGAAGTTFWIDLPVTA